MASTADIASRWSLLTTEERVQVWSIVSRDGRLWRPFPGPQSMAYHSEADVIGYGGAAGGGKTALICGLALEEHSRVLILRSDGKQTAGVTQYLTELLGTADGLNRQHGYWQVPKGRQPLIEFGGLKDPGSERVWQGRPHDLIAFDEATEIREQQVRFVLGWLRSSDPKQRTRALMTFNPPMTAEGRWVLRFFGPWLDRKHPKPAVPGELRWFTTRKDNPDFEVADGRPFLWSEDHEPVYDIPPDTKPELIVQPQSRTFFPARVADNPVYLASGYLGTLQSLAEPMRSRMLYGDFDAGIEDSEWQVCPTAWVEAAMARWKPQTVKPPMDCMGVDVARGGKDRTVLARRHGMWFDEPIVLEGKASEDGHAVAGAVMTHLRDQAVVQIDVIGVGASPYDILRANRQDVHGVVAGASPTAAPKNGRFRFRNYRSQLWWQMRELLDPANNTGIALPPDRRLLADLTAAQWRPEADCIAVWSREKIIDEIGRSPDWASAYLMAAISTVKRKALEAMTRARGPGKPAYNPIERF